METVKTAAFSGSLRKESYTTKLLKVFKKLAPAGVEIVIAGIGNLPLFNQDNEADIPDTINQLHRSIEQADVILLATPEYNRSYSPVLKNALDRDSRPQGENKWNKSRWLLVVRPIAWVVLALWII